MQLRDFRRLISLIVVLLVLAMGSFASIDNVAVQEGDRDISETAMMYPVVRVVDGDTIVVLVDGKEEKIRIIGINAPESVDPRRGVQCFGKEASAHLAAILEGQSVTLTVDPTQDDVDKYGRWLRYVDVPSMDVGRQMILDGYAYEYTYDEPYERQTEYRSVQVEAEDAGAGLWAEDTCNGEV